MSRVVSVFQSLKALKQTKPFQAISEANKNLMGYRKQEIGLFFDDLVPEENPTVQEALKRLSPQQFNDRRFRFRRALNLSLKKISLPESEWVTKEQDVRYLKPILEEIEAEQLTRFNYENLASPPAELLQRNRST